MKKFTVLIALLAAVLVIISSCSNPQGEVQSGAQSETEEIDAAVYFEAAEYLTEKIVISMPLANFENGEINKNIAGTLLINLVQNTEEIDIRNPYTDISYFDEDCCRFLGENCKIAVYEIFGIEDYDIKQIGYGGEYIEENDEYIINWGFGGSTVVVPSEIKAEASGAGGIAVNFTASKIENVAGDPVWIAFGEYQMQFEVLSENGKTFLRFVGLDGEKYPEISRADTSYPENQYDMSVEAFVKGENNEYIDYIYKVITSSHYGKSSYIEFGGFKSFKELNPNQLLNVFNTALQESGSHYAYESEKGYSFPKEDIKAVLGKYFMGIEPDFYAMFPDYDGGKTIEVLGIMGVFPYAEFGYRIEEIKDNKDGTVTVVIIRNGETMVNDSIIYSGMDGAKETFVIEPGENYCYVRSFEVEWPKANITERIDYGSFTLGIGPNTLEEILIDETLKISEGNFIGVNKAGEEFVILEYLGAEPVTDRIDVFINQDKRYIDADIFDNGLGGHEAKEYWVRKDFGRDVYFCISLGEEIVTFKYVPRAGRGGTRAHEIRELLDTIEIKK